ncbi:MAG: 5'-3' exonuclease H3TH domain-containing protein [Candidatus Parcubacteria bacterium]|nr:5'-3' exonuclease H3TH domain-containing protein [Candidatus Parcubacteria bacterium]
MDEKKKYLVIFDSNAVIHRAFHALPPLTAKNGEVVGAVYGFLLVFLKVLKEFKPEFVVAAFDLPFPTFRHKKYKEYKAKRPPTPESLYLQIPKVKEFMKTFNIPIFEKEGFEADDVIGTIAKQTSENHSVSGIETIIVSGDLDTLQLVDSNTKIYNLRKGVKDTVLYDEPMIKEKYGLTPKQILDYKALRGDPSDNIPGVTGVGEKTAIDLIKEFDNIENLYQEVEQNSEKAKGIKSGTREKLIKYKGQAFLSKELAEINTAVPIDYNVEDCRWQDFNRKKAVDILEEFGFKSLLDKLPGSETQKQTSKQADLFGGTG